MPSVMWFRRDLRLNDHPALNAAIDSAFEDGDKNVVALFNIDPKVLSILCNNFIKEILSPLFSVGAEIFSFFDCGNKF